MDPLHDLLEHGQSYWLDNLTRGMIRDGELERRVREEGLRGVTSNPAIFAKAISGGGEYDAQIASLAREGRSLEEIYEGVVTRDIRDACDVLRPVYDASDGRDGFVSLEVSPHLAHDAEATVREARRLYDAVGRPNVLIKIPGTPEGVAAIEEALYQGINVNVTLLFSIDAYEAVARAYLRALERRLEEGSDLTAVSSVASFFLSRIDVLVDRILGHRIRYGAPDEGPRPADLLGRAGIANAKLAYERFQDLFAGERWERLAAAGAAPQRMLWASTSTKDPLYSDVRYVEPLIGEHTVNTLPERTIEAFADHGRVDTTVEDDLDEAARVMTRLEEVGIDFDQVTAQLLHEGVQKFIDPYDRLTGVLARQRRTLLERDRVELAADLGDLEGTVDDALDALRDRRFPRRLAARDAGLWSSGRADTADIRRRLGWLDAGARFRDRMTGLLELAADVRDEGIRDVVVVGMGGSVNGARAVTGVIGPAEDHPALTVLDDTHPEAVRRLQGAVEPAETLFVVASKSGTTVETLALYRHFHAWAGDAIGEEAAGRHFVAITDAGSPLDEEAERQGFRACFRNPEDIGGRYSALSFFGLVPAALIGAGPGSLLEAAAWAAAECDPALPPATHPGVRLGAALGMAAREGRDKLTVFLSDGLEAAWPWLEQLVGESLGKAGVGLVPVRGETPVVPAAYGGDDRVFVHLRSADEEDRGLAPALEELSQAGHPVLRQVLPTPTHLGGAFFLWQTAVATAGAVLGVNPFDEPDVDAAKRETERLLARLGERGSLPEEEPAIRDGGVSVHGELDWLPAGGGGLLERAASAAADGGYLALLPYFPLDAARGEALEALRRALWTAGDAPVTVSRGPAYLHATGQLHKGGPASAVLVLVTHTPDEDVPIPGADHGFRELHRAQALADARVLAERGRRVMRIEISDPEQDLPRLLEAAGERPATAASPGG